MRRVGAIVLVALGVVLAALPASAAPARPDGGPADCTPGTAPYAGIAGASLRPEVHVSKDQAPVRYVRWRGTVPGYDGMPFSVDVTVPCGAHGPQPTVVMSHGFAEDKTAWEETGKSNTIRSIDRPAINTRWNNIWFASQGYVTLNYTARGWRDSCGPDTPGATASAPAPQCASFQHWIHLGDMRWEVRDAQWLAGGLVQSGLTDRRRLAITGGSSGGGPASMGALLAGRTMCGGASVPSTLGPDPCTGKRDGELVPWTTPNGRTRLSWAVSLPLYTLGDLVQVLAPNGRGSDGWQVAPADRSHTVPFGVPLPSTVSALLFAASRFGSLAPPGADPDADLRAWTARLLAGDPFPAEDPMVARAVRVDRDRRSPITLAPQGRVPIFWVQGFTDALFPALEAMSVRNHVLAADPSYPFKLFLGDIGHDSSAQREDEWDLVKAQMNEFLDHFLRPDRTPRRPAFNVGATVTRCLDPDPELQYLAASTWQDLHPGQVTFTSTKAASTSTRLAGPAGAAAAPTDPASVPGPQDPKGCRIVRPAQPDPTVASYEFPVSSDLVLMGGPVVDLHVDTTGPDVPIAVRVWDVAADGGAQGLVTRGIYRLVTPPGPDHPIRFQIALQGYRFRAGHRIKVEVTANDAPYRQASNVPSELVVRRLAITLPLLGDAGGGTPSTVVASPVPGASVDPLPGPRSPEAAAWHTAALWSVAVAGFALIALGFAVTRRRV
ncbi:MAG: X-Pro dipeptidyl-peptidase domain protein [Acidimicrobiales bacterium]|nr:X-Pro dipeptidyl-peptidase domain protein [Acidimicrobiales bacterium]